MDTSTEEGVTESSCMPERAALIKSILNFLKKAIPEPTFAENIRNCTLIITPSIECLCAMHTKSLRLGSPQGACSTVIGDVQL